MQSNELLGCHVIFCVNESTYQIAHRKGSCKPSQFNNRHHQNGYDDGDDIVNDGEGGPVKVPWKLQVLLQGLQYNLLDEDGFRDAEIWDYYGVSAEQTEP